MACKSEKRPFEALHQYFEKGGRVEPEAKPTPHTPSNPNETTTLLDAREQGGEKVMHRSPKSIETIDEKGRLHDYDPKLADSEVLASIPMTQGPDPEHYFKGGKVKGMFDGRPDTVTGRLTPGEEVIPREPAQRARQGNFQQLEDYFKKYRRG